MCLVCLVGVLVLLCGVGCAFGEGVGVSAWWNVGVGSRPSSLPGVGELGQLFVTVENVGDGAADGGVAPVVVSGVVPSGLRVVAVKAFTGENILKGLTLSCGVVGGVVSCTLNGVLEPFEQIEMQVLVRVGGEAVSGEVFSASVSGGGARSVGASRVLSVGGPAVFGFEEFKMVPENVGGGVDTRAGSHPFQATTTVTFNTQSHDEEGNPRSAGLVKDVVTELPAGMIGNPIPFAQCTDAQFARQPEAKEAPQPINECPAASAVGVALVTINEPSALKFATFSVPIFNMTPLHGEPARFGFKAAGIFPVYLDAAVRTGSDYGITVTSANTTEVAWALSARVTLWGVPGEAVHDHQRGWECLGNFGTCPTSTAVNPPPFLVMPTSCSLPFVARIRGDSWGTGEHPAQIAEPVSYELPEMVDGCNQLPFAPSIRVSPDGNAGSTPTGLTTDVHVPQTALLNKESLAESAVRDITVTLPEGVAVNPSDGDGLAACSEGEVGYLGKGGEALQFTPLLEEPSCPNAAKVATVKITVPVLANPLEGAAYIATQNENPFGGLLAMYLIAQDPVSGVLIKLAGEVHLSPTGQLTATFANSPQAPFEDAELHFFGGERAPLATPARCGAYTTSAMFTPWSGNPPVASSSVFDITSGPNGSACPGASLPFSATLAGGTVNNNASKFSPLVTTINREDGNQNIQAVTVTMPPGLSGILTGIPLCPEAQANEGTCPPASQIGETTVSAGVGADPVSVTGGKVFITETYEGAPFGLSIVDPVKAGPFDLEHDTSNPNQHPPCDCVVVRAKITINPVTAALTATTNLSGPHAIPTIIDGIPVQLKHVNVTINRPGFTFNPTNCSPLTITATITSNENTASSTTIPFQAANCAVLGFAPKLHVSVTGNTSKRDGAGLTATLTYPNTPFGTQTNIARAKVDLPKQLPSRLTTLQKACLASTFETNPADCPPASIVGHATVTTPLVPVPLTGPAYFVSHGNEAFPSLTLVLQGYGITITLTGSTFIKNGITSTTFKNPPDAPFYTFTLTLPQGPYSAITANTNLCKPNTKLTMPTAYTAQNNTQTNQNTPITITNCPKAKKSNRKHRKRHKARRASHKARGASRRAHRGGR